MGGDNSHDLPDKEQAPKPVSQLPSAFLRYRKSVDALREFFSHLNPVVSELDTDVAKRREQKAHDVMERFARRADDADRKALEKIVEFMAKASAAPGGSQKIEIESHLAGETVLNVLEAFRDMTPSQSHRELLNRSILTSLVGYFEQLVADLAHAFYSLVPEATSNDDKVLSVNDLRSFDSVKEAMDFVVSKRVDDLLRGTLEDWDKFFSTRMKTEMLRIVPDSAQWSEMIQRRHVIVHSAGVVTRRYLEKVDWQEVSWPEAKPSLEAVLSVDDLYLERALDLFEIAGLLLCQEVWKKLKQDEVELRHNDRQGLGGAVYARLESKRWYVAEHLASWGANDEDAGEGRRLTHACNRWLAVKRQGRMDEIAKELEDLDLSAKNASFRLARAALLERPDDFYKCLPEAIVFGVTEESLREWPIMEEIRADERFESELSKAFKETRSPGGNSSTVASTEEPND